MYMCVRVRTCVRVYVYMCTCVPEYFRRTSDVVKGEQCVFLQLRASENTEHSDWAESVNVVIVPEYLLLGRNWLRGSSTEMVIPDNKSATFWLSIRYNNWELLNCLSWYTSALCPRGKKFIKITESRTLNSSAALLTEFLGKRKKLNNILLATGNIIIIPLLQILLLKALILLIKYTNIFHYFA